MRSAIVAALAALAIAAPAPVVTQWEVVDVYTTVWDDGSAPEPTTSSAVEKQYHAKPNWSSAYTPQAQPSEAPAVPSVQTYAPAPAASSAAPSASASASSGAGQAVLDDYQTAVVNHHNAHRANHSAPDLQWLPSLATTAKKIADSCVYAHDTSMDGGGYGQNIAAGCPASNVSSAITELFYNNEVGNFANLYGQATPSNIDDASAFDGWGHFTQIVWKDTAWVGCATTDCSGKGLANTGSNVPPYFTVCNYKNAGNYVGEFDAQVSESLGHPSISWAST